MRWWLTPFWAKGLSTKYSMFNAKSETAAKSPAFREPFRKRRCVVPISGFYEWERANGQKLPYYIKPHRDRGLLLAGLWDHWHNPEDDSELESFTILTTAVHESLSFVHNRQPVMLSVADAKRWLDPTLDTDSLQSLFGALLPMSLDVVPVSTYVNNARHNDPRCIEPTGDAVAIGADP
jgi:putative SOS response-associated peptidase YedK